ncbi:MAG: RnfABCDGE type electron transport complex subunit G [Candidatus Cloacimonetes bacterium]|nr:RnfABCDGE type electron transport complex subunit G [Candidatus Cloacimonadota bacterium]MCF7813227.1 RnfABCDGE type electron transport complex subunit G [Candidatus Cloacimonadota bacterium]MCF7867426.1 RnfABCDGE type electron transport complex subunit G [Candidatus Cloacimonadota bacterium]MCF7882942.1 RnfABCDGE type electron transport complex subunit G [Candidatus Cloacimonadota bacterium]
MKYYIKLGFVLLIITAIASGILAYINSFTEPIIAENQRKAKEEARKEVLPDAASFEVIGSFNNEDVFAGKDDSGNTIGFTFLASLYGYSSDVKSMIGVKTDLIVNKIKIISQTETPGLGANCEKPEFQAQFSDKGLDQMKVDKDGGPIASITGATITTRTVANSIKDGLIMLEKLVAEKMPSETETKEVTE